MIRPLPKRVARIAPIGSLLKHAFDRVPQRRSIETPADPAYLEMIRQLPCIKCGMEPCGEAAHVRLTSAAFHKRGGIGKKPEDRWALPLDRGCHQVDPDALHRVGEYLFWHALGINPLLICERLYAQRGDLVAMRAVILSAMAERR
jgi:hypothetical protein